MSFWFGREITSGIKIKFASRIKMGARRAFTLIELMVVMILLGILSAMILPAMKGTYEDALLRSTGRELINVLHLAYSRAVSMNEVHRVRIEESTGRYVLEAQAPEAAGDSGFSPVKDVPGSEGTLDNRIAISVHLGASEPSGEPGEGEPTTAGPDLTATTSETAFTFYPDGAADGGEVRLQDRDGFRLALRINPVTGGVRVVELARE